MQSSVQTRYKYRRRARHRGFRGIDNREFPWRKIELCTSFHINPGPLINPVPTSNSEMLGGKGETTYDDTYDDKYWPFVAKRLQNRRRVLVHGSANRTETVPKWRKGELAPEAAGAIMAARVLIRHAPHPRLVRERPDHRLQECRRKLTLQWILERQKRRAEEQRDIEDEHNNESTRALATDTQA